MSRLKIEDARSKASAKIAVLGAGFAGLTIAYKLTKAGHQVVVFEKQSRAGGLARGFKLPDWDWYLEESYHHFFASDNEAVELIKELELTDKLIFKRPVTTIYYQSQEHKNTRTKKQNKKSIVNYQLSIRNSNIFPFDTPFNFLSFPHLSLLDKMRAGTALSYLKLNPNWKHLENIPAKKWIEKTMGKRVWKILWEPLFINKFGKSAEKVSAAWFWARIKKRSQKLGYFKGGLQMLAEKMVEKIEKSGGKVHFNSEVKKITLFKHQLSIQVNFSCCDRNMKSYFEKNNHHFTNAGFFENNKGVTQKLYQALAQDNIFKYPNPYSHP